MIIFVPHDLRLGRIVAYSRMKNQKRYRRYRLKRLYVNAITFIVLEVRLCTALASLGNSFVLSRLFHSLNGAGLFPNLYKGHDIFDICIFLFAVVLMSTAAP